MASIKFSALISDARGKVGGNIFARNKGGSYVRAFAMPTNPSTGKQERVRQICGQIASGWRELTESARVGWNEAALNFPQMNRLGEQIYLSGQQLFLKFNATLSNAGLDQVLTPPSPTEIPQVFAGFDTLTATALTVDFLDTDLVDTTSVIVEMTRPVSAGRMNAFRSDFVRVATVSGTDAKDVVNLKAAYEAAVSPLAGQAGKKIFGRVTVIVVASGQAGTPASFNSIIA